jgi:Flp pilus assembly protein TadG
MNVKIASRTHRLLKNDSGQVLPMMAVLMVGMLSTAALSIDLGRAYYDYRELQSSTNAAALAGAQALPNSTAATNAAAYSSGAGDDNAQSNLPSVTMPAGYPKLLCLATLTNQGIPCPSPANANAIQVKQQATVPMLFARIFGKSSLTLTATATAAARGAGNTPYNVAIILDATLSQNSTDSNCGGTTEMGCELQGVQILLAELDPCSGAYLTCTFTNGQAQDSVDRVALFTFPAVTVGTVGIDSSCTTPISAPANWRSQGNSGYYNQSPYGWYTLTPATPVWYGVPTGAPYAFPTVGASSYSPASSPTTTPTYQVTPYLSDYRTSDTATSLNPSSQLVKAVGGGSNCGGMMPPNYDGNIGTYYAGVLYAAQASLVAQQAANPGSQNVIILLSDGNATAPQSNGNMTGMPSPATNGGTYPSYKNECAQAVTAANYITNLGTKVYSVAYGSASSGCTTDSSRITPCQTMTQIASAPQDFYSDYQQTGSNSTCVSASNPNDTSIAKIFADIRTNFSQARLIPNGTS